MVESCNKEGFQTTAVYLTSSCILHILVRNTLNYRPASVEFVVENLAPARDFLYFNFQMSTIPHVADMSYN